MKLADCNTLEQVIAYWSNELFNRANPYAEEEKVLRRAAQIGWERGIKDAVFRIENFPAYTHGALKQDVLEVANQVAGEIASGIRAAPLPDEFKGDDV